MTRAASALILLSLAVAGCGGGEARDKAERPVVVATTPIVADIAREVAGTDARVVSIVPRNADPHEYEVRPDDIEALADADLIVRSGGEIDEWLGDAIESAGGQAPVVDLLDETGGGEDPHWWQDPKRAILAVANLGEHVSRVVGGERNPDGERRLRRDLRRLDAAIAACWKRVEPGARTIVTTHDSLAPYARRYGLRVVGTVIPSRSTRGQASAGDVDRLVGEIRRSGAKAVFPEAAISGDVERAIAREAGAVVGGELFTDALGPPGSPAGTYLGALAHNTRALIEGATGGKVACSI